MLINHTVSSLDNPSAGTTYSVFRLTEELYRLNKSTILTSISSNISCKKEFEEKFLLDGFPKKLSNRLYHSRKLKKYLFNNYFDIYHIHGMWTLPNFYPAAAAIANNAKLMLSPHGMMGKEALSFSKYKKRLARILYQDFVLKNVTCFRATSFSEYKELRDFGLTQPVAIIPNGIDPAPIDPTPAHKKQNKVISLGRIHPKKGLDRLISAWTKIEYCFPEWTLEIIGPDENGHRFFLERLCKNLKLNNVVFRDAVYGHEKSDAMSSASLFILPTLNENFAITVAESLAYGTPVISSKGAPWGGLIEHQCGWWVDGDADSLAGALLSAMRLSEEERCEMGLRGRSWICEEFQWATIARQLLQTYEWMLGKREIPAWVYID